MLLVVLKILKIIGIAILFIIGFILVLALMILLLPVKYRISAEKTDDGPLSASFKLTYFFRILRAYAVYEKKLEVRVKVLWFTLFEMKIPSDKVEEELSGDMFGFDDEDFDEIDDPEDITDSAENNEEENDLPDENVDENESPGSDSPETDNADEEITEDSAGDDETDSLSEGDEENDFDESENIISKLKYKVNEFCDKIDKVRAEYRYYHNVLNSNEAAYAVRNLKKRLMRILKKVLPRRVHADIVYGFDSPDITGKVYGLYCIFRNRFDKSSVVRPDFDKAVFEGIVFAKGHFNIWCIIYNAAVFVLSPSSIKIYRSVRRHRNKKYEQDSSEDKAAA